MRAFKRRNGQCGQATIEYLIVISVLLLLLLASLQFIFIYEAKQTLNYATFVGTRSGALNNGAMAAIQDGLSSGLAPLFTHGVNLQAVKDARRQADTELADNKLTLIQIVNPTLAALGGFDTGNGIPNDTLMYRDPDVKQDSMNVQDANLLKVRVTYCVRLAVPVVNRMIYGFAVAPPTTPAKIDQPGAGAVSPAEILAVAAPGSGSGLCAQDSTHTDYRIPVSSEAVVRMQSPFKDPVKWTAP